MKNIKLIEIIVVTYFHENRGQIDENRLQQILTESLNIEIGDVKLEGDILKVYYGPKLPKRKKIIFEIHNEKIKHRKEENG
jgi:hypothetical protein